MQYSPIKTVRSLSLIMAAMFITGCQLLPDYLRPEVALPNKYAESETLQPELQQQIASNWWTLYQDPTLNTLIEHALQQNKDIQLAVARIEEADAAMREVGAFLLPQINLEGSARKTRVTEAGAFPVFAANPRNNFNFAFGTNFELDFWGRLRNAREAARAQAMSSRYARDTVTLSLTSLLANYYLTLRSLESQIVVAEENLKSRDSSLALTKRRLEGGVASGLDVHQAQVSSANLRAQIADLKRMRALSLHQLAVLSGDLNLAVAGLQASPADLNTLPLPPVPPAGMPSALLESRPDIRQAEAQMIAANANIAVAKAALYPTISLTANLGGESLELSDVLKSAARIWTGGLSLNLPIFDAGRLDARVDQATARQKQALASYEGAIQTAFREVNDALVNLRQYTEREASLLISQQEAKKALELSENRYASGYSSYIEVLDAQRVYSDASLAYIQSRQARLTATVDLFKALGGGWKETQS